MQKVVKLVSNVGENFYIRKKILLFVFNLPIVTGVFNLPIVTGAYSNEIKTVNKNKLTIHSRYSG